MLGSSQDLKIRSDRVKIQRPSHVSMQIEEFSFHNAGCLIDLFYRLEVDYKADWLKD